MSRAFAAPRERTVILTEGERSMSDPTAFGDPQSRFIYWNRNWKAAQGKADWICKFVCDDSHFAKEYPYIYLAGQFNGWYEPYIFTPDQEIWASDKKTVACRAQIALAAASLACTQPPEDYVELLGHVNSQVLAFYLQAPSLAQTFPLLHQICTQNLADAGYVYLISDQQGHYKIGKANNISRRLFQLKTQPPFKLSLLESAWHPRPLLLERKLHNQFRDLRLNGEWFDLDDSTLNDAIQYLQNISKGWAQLSSIYESGKQDIDFLLNEQRRHRPLLSYISVDGRPPQPLDLPKLSETAAQEPVTSDRW